MQKALQPSSEAPLFYLFFFVCVRVHVHVEARANFGCFLNPIHLGFVCVLDKAPH